MTLKRNSCIVVGCTDIDDSSRWRRGRRPRMFDNTLQEERHTCLGDIKGALDIDLLHRLESIRTQRMERRKEISRCSGTEERLSPALASMPIPRVCTHALFATHIRKSIPPSSTAHLLAADSRSARLRTSTPPIPRTLDPRRTRAISFATRSVFWTLRPTMHASAPSTTKALTWAEQILPLPPVQNTTLPSDE